jgi:rhodanese-related sulfurtransferase
MAIAPAAAMIASPTCSSGLRFEKTFFAAFPGHLVVRGCSSSSSGVSGGETRRPADVSCAIRRGGVAVGSRSVRLQALAGGTTLLRSVPVQVANELIEAGHMCLDVRTPEEFLSGHIEGAFNVPYMFSKSGGMSKNTDFVQSVAELFTQDDEIVLVCHNGKRSVLACSELQSAGYMNCTDMGGGTSAWAKSGLPFVT